MSEGVVGTVEQIIEINLESEQGYERAARIVEEPAVGSLFREIAAQRGAFARELEPYVFARGGEQAANVSVGARLRLWWTELRARMALEPREEVVKTAERGERVLEEAYNDALARVRTGSVHDILVRQRLSLLHSHRRVMSLLH